MTTTRTVETVLASRPTIEGAGVHLKRAFGFNEARLLDPFLMLDDFHSDNPDDYVAGFPWHPHRGIETVSYMLSGTVEHQDSLGNKGAIGSGDIQWMTAGSGIIHQEMPNRTYGYLQGFQLWVNLPAAHKMMRPRYRGITCDQVPKVTTEEGATVRVVSGSANGADGPVKDLVVDTFFLDVTVPPKASFTHPTPRGHRVFAYVIDGGGFFNVKSEIPTEPEHAVVFGDGDRVTVRTENRMARFLLLGGKPLNEPVAWYGPIVMNTQEELETAFREYRDGTFLKHT